MIYPYYDKIPKVDASVFIADYATITGDVTIGAMSSIWFNAVIRGDVSPTIIGERVNIQDFACLHQSPAFPLIIEDDATIGHRATLHSCHIKRNALIGMDATVLDGAIIGEGAFIGAGSLVPPGKEIPDGMMAYGSPVRVVRPLTEAEKEDMQRIRSEYVEKGQYYRSLQK